MDLSIITADWPYDDKDEVKNVRKIVGVDGLMKLQVRLRNGLVQWAVEGRPDGADFRGSPTALDYGQKVVQREGCAGAECELDDAIDDLAEELFDYSRRSCALFYVDDYGRALSDLRHCLDILRFIRANISDPSLSFSYDRHRPILLVNLAQTEMLLQLRAGSPRKAMDGLNRAITAVEEFYSQYEMDDVLPDCTERQILVDLRRSLRERHNVPLSNWELLHSLKVEQEIAIRKENYEMAARLRDKMALLEQKSGARR